MGRERERERGRGRERERGRGRGRGREREKDKDTAMYIGQVAEAKVRSLLEETMKVLHHSNGFHRLCPADINMTIEMKEGERLYGYPSSIASINSIYPVGLQSSGM